MQKSHYYIKMDTVKITRLLWKDGDCMLIFTPVHAQTSWILHKKIGVFAMFHLSEYINHNCKS